MKKRRWPLLLAAALLAGAFTGCSLAGEEEKGHPSPNYAALQVKAGEGSRRAELRIRTSRTARGDKDFARSAREFWRLCFDGDGEAVFVDV